jgi:hypothetical protein
MKLAERINSLLPVSVSEFQQAQARIIINTSIAISAAMLALVLYWVVTGTLEDIETIFIVFGLLLVFVGIIALVKYGHLLSGAWILIGVMLLLNLVDMTWYGISSVASAGYVIPILIAAFSISPKAGMSVSILGCVSVFSISYLASIGQLHTEIPYQESTLSFDAPTLSLIYLIASVLAGNWVRSTQKAFQKS